MVSLFSAASSQSAASPGSCCFCTVYLQLVKCMLDGDLCGGVLITRMMLIELIEEVIDTSTY